MIKFSTFHQATRCNRAAAGGMFEHIYFDIVVLDISKVFGLNT